MPKISKNPNTNTPTRKASGDARGYASRVTLRAPRERVFDALTTIAGLCGWWTTRVSGSASSGGDVRFDFEGLDEYIVILKTAIETVARRTMTPNLRDKIAKYSAAVAHRYGEERFCDFVVQIR